MTTALPQSPFANRSLSAYGADLRLGAISAESATADLLDRIRLTQARLGAVTYVDERRALAHGRALDGLLTAGVDLGPLMGVPVLLKDLYAVEGMPMTAGSRVDVADLVPAQGAFVTALQRAGCVLLGKAATVEFALGGCNLTHRLPWNPCDPAVSRMTGGSSHGSAVALAAGLCGFSVGGDTGGSVRWPAALCGVVGFKTTGARWPGEGIFPLSPSLDSVGYFTHSAEDAAFLEAALSNTLPLPVPALAQLRFGLPSDHFLEDLDPEVAACFERALQRLRAAGVTVVALSSAEASEIDEVFRALVPADLLAFLGRERVRSNLTVMDPVAAERAKAAFDLPADSYLRLAARRRELVRLMRERSAGIDAWVSPTVPMLPRPIAEYSTVGDIAAWNRRATRNTRPGNLFDQCGVSLPIHQLGAPWPVGLQLCADAGTDARLLAVARAVEGGLGRAPLADAADFTSPIA